MKVLLVEPNYYTRYPPLGLLKLAAYHKQMGDEVELVRGTRDASFTPDRICITSLFTWDWPSVHGAVGFYREKYRSAEVQLGGIYASLLPEHARRSGADVVWEGLKPEVEDFMPDYSLVPEWQASLLFATRGCTRKCGFCSVPKLEGSLTMPKGLIAPLIFPSHGKAIFFDNNILGSPKRYDIFAELGDLHVECDFNQGMDARYMTDEVAGQLSEMNIPTIRLAYDYIGIRPFVENAIRMLRERKIAGKRIVFYVLYNYLESPDDFYHKVTDLMNWGVVSYPMRYEPLCTLEKNRYVAPKWTAGELEMVAKARRVLGYGGSFPAYKGLVEKFNDAGSFAEAFRLREKGLRRQPAPTQGIADMAVEHGLVPD